MANNNKKIMSYIKDPEIIDAYFNEAKKSPIIYIGSVFILYAGLYSYELYDLTVEEVAGNSYLNKTTGQILLYSDSFRDYLAQYINSLPEGCNLLMNCTNEPPYCPIKQSTFSTSISRIFKKIGYPGNASTLHWTHYYLDTLNRGAFGSEAYKPIRTIKFNFSNVTSLDKEWFANVRDNYVNHDFLPLLVPHFEELIRELDIYLADDIDSPVLRKKVAALYSALYDLSCSMNCILKQ